MTALLDRITIENRLLVEWPLMGTREISIGVIVYRAIPFRTLKAREQTVDVDSIVSDIIELTL